MRAVDVGDYPTQHQYAFYSNFENMPGSMVKVLEDSAEFEGLSVLDTLSKLIKFLDNVSDIGQHLR